MVTLLFMAVKVEFISGMKIFKIVFSLIILSLCGCSIRARNDVLSDVDEDFTHGTEFVVQGKIEEFPELVQEVVEFIPDITLRDHEEPTHIKATVGQHIYTPADLSSSEVVVDDNPYAGWLFGEVTRQVLKKDEKREVSISLGVIGDYSFAEETQKFVHNDLGRGEDPKGWDHQLGNEVGVIASIGRETKLFEQDLGPVELDALHGADIRLGNIFTDVGYGGKLRIGKNLPGFNGYKENWSIYGYTGASGRAVGRNLFYDGNTFKDSHRVQSEPLLGSLNTGAVIQLFGWEISFSYSYTSSQHKQYEGGGHPMWYINISKALGLFD
jgi:lipid A 3-O-deacylase